MKTKLSILIFSLFISLQTFAQTTNQIMEEWMSTSGTQEFFFRAKTKTDALRNVYIAGATLDSTGHYDVLVAKYDEFGSLFWMNQFDVNGGDDVAADLTIDNHYNVYITGATFTSDTDSTDVLVMRYDSSGAYNWHVVYDGAHSRNDGGSSILFENDSIYIGGSVGDTVRFTNFLAQKYDLMGNLIWSNTYDEDSLHDIALKIDRITGGKLMVSGATELGILGWDCLTVGFGIYTGAVISHATTGGGTSGLRVFGDATKDASGNIYITGSIMGSSMDFYTVKLNSNLVVQWASTFNSNGTQSDEGKGIAVDGSGNVYVTGYSDSTGQSTNITTLKYNSSGTLQWVKKWNGGSNGPDSGKAVIVDLSGNIVITGSSWNGSDEDIYSIKYNSSGTILWEVDFNSKYSRNDRPTDIAIDIQGNVIVVGESQINDSTFEYVTIKYREYEITMPPDTESVSGVISFVKNNDQLIGTDSNAVDQVEYYSTQTVPALYFMDDTLSYVFARVDNDTATTDTLHRVDMWFDGYSGKILPLNKDQEYTNYFLGHIPEGRGRTPQYKSLYKSQVWDGIDVLYTTNNAGLKFDFILGPGIHPDQINMRFTGQDSVYLQNDSLIIVTPLGKIIYPQAEAYLDSADVKLPLGWQPDYHVDGGLVIFQNLGVYNPSHKLILKMKWGEFVSTSPTDNIDWSTYVGGAAPDATLDIYIDDGNNLYSCGETSSLETTFPVNTGIDISFNGVSDGWIAKFNSNRGKEWMTYWGGSGKDFVRTISFIELHNQIAFAGFTQSPETSFPILDCGGYIDDIYGNSASLFVAKINAFGNTNLWCSYFAQGPTEIHTCTSDLLGNFYIGGVVFDGAETDFPTASPGGSYTQTYQGGGNDAFISKFDPLNGLAWSTTIGGNNAGTNTISEEVNGMYTDASNNLYVTGSTASYSTFDGSGSLTSPCTINTSPLYFPGVSPGGSAYEQGYEGGLADAWIGKFNSNNAIVWSTLFGGSGTEIFLGNFHNFDGVCVDPANGDIWMVGSSKPGTNFPIEPDNTTGAYNQATYGTGGGYDAFIAKFNDQFELIYSTLYGGNGDDAGIGVRIGGDNVYITGWTSSTNFPVESLTGCYYESLLNQTGSGSESDAFIIELSSSGERTWATYYGGIDDDKLWAMDVDANANNIVFAGESSSNNFPVFDPPGSLDWTDEFYNLGRDGFISNFHTLTYTGISEEEKNKSDIENSLLVYPNPTFKNILIKTNLESSYKLSIYDILGQKIYSEDNVTGQEKKIDVSQLPNNLYIIQIISEGIIQNCKFIKQ